MNRTGIIIIGVVLLLIVGGLLALQLTPRGNGVVDIGVIDGPVNATHIYMTITNITLQSESNTTVNYKVGPVSFDLLSFVSVTKFLGNVSIPAGNYTMIRFTVTAATATRSGSNTTLTVPSGQIKVPVHFQVKSGEYTTIVLDIVPNMTNISASLNLSPVVHVKSVTGPK